MENALHLNNFFKISYNTLKIKWGNTRYYNKIKTSIAFQKKSTLTEPFKGSSFQSQSCFLKWKKRTSNYSTKCDYSSWNNIKINSLGRFPCSCPQNIITKTFWLCLLQELGYEVKAYTFFKMYNFLFLPVRFPATQQSFNMSALK